MITSQKRKRFDIKNTLGTESPLPQVLMDILEIQSTSPVVKKQKKSTEITETTTSDHSFQ